MPLEIVNNTLSSLSPISWSALNVFDYIRLIPALLGIVGATLTIVALSTKPFADKLKSSVDMFHGNMAVADLLDSLNYPLNLLVYALMRFWQFDMSPTLCIAEVSLNQICSSATLLSTAFMSVDRYQAVKSGRSSPSDGFAYGVVVCLSLLSYILPGLVHVLLVVLPSSKSLDSLCGIHAAFEICDGLIVLLNVASLAITIGLSISASRTLKQKFSRSNDTTASFSDSLATKEQLRLLTVLILQAFVSMASVVTDLISVVYLVIFSSQLRIQPELIFVYEFESALNAVLVFSLLPPFRKQLRVALHLKKNNRITYIDNTH